MPHIFVGGYLCFTDVDLLCAVLQFSQDQSLYEMEKSARQRVDALNKVNNLHFRILGTCGCIL